MHSHVSDIWAHAQPHGRECREWDWRRLWSMIVWSTWYANARPDQAVATRWITSPHQSQKPEARTPGRRSIFKLGSHYAAVGVLALLWFVFIYILFVSNSVRVKKVDSAGTAGPAGSSRSSEEQSQQVLLTDCYDVCDVKSFGIRFNRRARRLLQTYSE